MDLNEKRGNAVEELDPRMKLLILLLYTTVTFLSVDNYRLIYNYGLILVLFFLSKLYISGIKVCIFVATLLLIGQMGTFIPNDQFPEIFVLVLDVLQRVSVFFIMGIWMSSKLRVGDFLTSMEKMHIPKGIIITMAVVFRYLPTVKQEFYYIKNTMRLRGIGINAKNIMLHPLKTIEYSIVPLVIRCMTIADELSASAMTRGLDLETKRVSYREVKIGIPDILITCVFAVAIVSGNMLGARIKGGLF